MDFDAILNLMANVPVKYIFLEYRKILHINKYDCGLKSPESIKHWFWALWAYAT